MRMTSHKSWMSMKLLWQFLPFSLEIMWLECCQLVYWQMPMLLFVNKEFNGFSSGSKSVKRSQSVMTPTFIFKEWVDCIMSTHWQKPTVPIMNEKMMNKMNHLSSHIRSGYHMVPILFSLSDQRHKPVQWKEETKHGQYLNQVEQSFWKTSRCEGDILMFLSYTSLQPNYSLTDAFPYNSIIWFVWFFCQCSP